MDPWWIKSNLNRIKSSGVFYHSDLEKNVRLVEWSHYNGEKKIELRLSHGFGAGEEKVIIEFSEDDLENQLKKFEPKKSISKSHIIMAEENKKNASIQDIRTILYDTLQKVKSGTMDHVTARSISNVAQTFINTLKIELEYRQQIGIKDTISAFSENERRNLM